MHFQYKTHLMPAEIEISIATYRGLMSYLTQEFLGDIYLIAKHSYHLIP